MKFCQRTACLFHCRKVESRWFFWKVRFFSLQKEKPLSRTKMAANVIWIRLCRKIPTAAMMDFISPHGTDVYLIFSVIKVNDSTSNRPPLYSFIRSLIKNYCRINSRPRVRVVRRRKFRPFVKGMSPFYSRLNGIWRSNHRCE